MRSSELSTPLPGGARPSRVAPGDPAWPLVEAFVAASDPVRDLLVWADVVSSIARLSRIWLAHDGDTPLGVVFAFPLWPTRPSLGVKAQTPALERAMLQALIAEGALTSGYVITEPAQSSLFAELGTVSGPHQEAQLVLDARQWVPRPLTGVRRAEQDELDAFYRAQGAAAWNPVQFDTGPYFVAEEAGRIVAAAGTHFAYDGLAQLGNVFTDPAHRGHGHAERVTAAVAQALAAAGTPTLSLFVATDNLGARRIYERLGFAALRTLDAFAWDVKG